jgi:glucokinase
VEIFVRVANGVVLNLTQEGGECQLLLKLANHDLKSVTAKVVMQAYKEGDKMALRLMDRAKNALIAGVASVINAFNPCRLILGGGLIDGMPELIDLVNKGVRRLALKAATQSLEIVRAKLGKQVGVIGSAAAIFNLFKPKEEVI